MGEANLIDDDKIDTAYKAWSPTYRGVFLGAAFEAGWHAVHNWQKAVIAARDAEIARLQAQLADQAEVIGLAQFVASNDDTRIAGMQGIYALRAGLARLDASPQEARQQAAERAVRAGVVLPNG